MATWSNDELMNIGSADELQIAPQLRGGTPLRPVTIWVVRVGDDLYVRSYKGHAGAWFRAARASHAGRIQAGGVDKEATFVEELDPGINDQIDAAYRSKYHRYAGTHVPPMLTEEVRATTLKLLPHSTPPSR